MLVILDWEQFWNKTTVLLHIPVIPSPSQNETTALSRKSIWQLYMPPSNSVLGCQFQIQTDHAPLQWLSAQQMEGLLCRWALALQEYSFTIVHRKLLPAVFL